MEVTPLVNRNAKKFPKREYMRIARPPKAIPKLSPNHYLFIIKSSILKLLLSLFRTESGSRRLGMGNKIRRAMNAV